MHTRVVGDWFTYVLLWCLDVLWLSLQYRTHAAPRQVFLLGQELGEQERATHNGTCKAYSEQYLPLKCLHKCTHAQILNVFRTERLSTVFILKQLHEQVTFMPARRFICVGQWRWCQIFSRSQQALWHTISADIVDSALSQIASFLKEVNSRSPYAAVMIGR